MAETFLSTVAEGIIRELGNAAVKEIALLWGVDDELQQLEDTISTIKSVLVDAEKQQLKHQQIKTWLERLEDAVYEADDLVDEFSTEALQRQVMTGNRMAKQVRNFCSSPKQFPFLHKMGKKIRHLRKKLDKIADDRLKFHLVTGLPLDAQVVTLEREEHSFERQENVIGRDYEKKEIIKHLFDMNTEENLVVIPLVGVGGLGKTTLAQLVYNDTEVRKHFELVMWVNVPKDFDVKLVVKEIIKPEVKNERTMDELQQDLRTKIGGKQFLLVLDDVWAIDSREKWLKLENLLRDGGNRSRIIVTTRDKKIAHIINGREETTYNLGILNDEMAWCLFKKLAFMHGQEPNDPNLVKIGKDIVDKCGGIPLVIRTIASMLYCINFEEWSSFKETELSSIAQYDNDIIPTLKLSYDHLQSHLKHCFGYCRLFPKNHVYDVEMLINLWMAQGFITLSNYHPNQCLEDIGYQYFKDLLYRSFFEVVEMDDCSKVTKCKMHDCMHDLSISVTGTKGLILSSNDEKIDERTRHVSFNFTVDSLHHQALLVRRKRIRTIFVLNGYESSSRMLKKSILKCQFLRTLDLHDAGLWIIPKSLGKLKHLRYLNLSRNYMKALPNSITRLQNLQTLNLSYCNNLREIPSDIIKLVNLRHLYIESHWGTTLHCMPGGLDQLTNLQTVSLLPPSDLKNRCLDLYQWIPLNIESFFLHHISNWKTLNMIGIGDLQHLPDGLKSLTCLEELSIERCSKLESLSPGLNHLTSLLKLSIEECPDLQAVSPALCHLTLLQLLDISRCSKLKSLSPGLNHLASLLKLSIEECPELETLSPALHHLTSLERLEVGFCDKLEMPNSGSDATILWQRLQGLSVLKLGGLPKLVALPQGLQQVTTLEEIEILKCENLESILECISNLKSLKKLSIVDCPKLKFLPEGTHALNSLIIRKCTILLEKCRDDIGDYWPMIAHIKELVLSPVTEEAEFSEEGVVLEEPIPVDSDPFFYHLFKLKTLRIDGIKDLEHLPDGLKRLTSLEKLEIEKCSKLQSLSPGLHHLTSLQHLHIRDCEELEMPNNDGSDAIMWQHLQSLSMLCLIKLPKLVALPQGLQQLTTLQEITIYRCENLESILENISNLKLLKKLDIRNCPNLKFLPEGIRCVTSLEILEIEGCPILLERCQENMGDYWPMISHIKQIRLSAVTKEQQHEPHQQEESTSSKTCGLFDATIFKH